MEFLRKLILQTQTHLQGLTTSQRMAILSLAGLIVVSIFWLISWAGKAEMVALLDQPLTAEELTQVRKQLDADGVKYQQSGDRLLVPTDRVVSLQAKLAQSDALPRDISITFNKLIDNASPWLAADEQDRRYNMALANELGLRIRLFSGVQVASVFLDKNTKRTIGPVAVAPTASIQVTMKSGQSLDRPLAKAMASFVSRAVSGLDISNVQVTDTSGRTFSMPRQDEMVGEDDLENRQKREKYFKDQIRELFATTIPNIDVVVRAEIDPRATTTNETEYGKPVKTKDTSKTSETSEGRSPNEPGTVPNTGTPNVATGSNSRTEETVSETTFDAAQDRKMSTTVTRANRLVSLSAAINVPRSYLATIYKNANNDKDPTDAELDSAPSTQTILTRIKSQVETLMLKDNGKENKTEVAKSLPLVTVNWFHDHPAMPMFGSVAADGTGSSSKLASADSMKQYMQMYGGKVGLGALAVISLFMMLMMVRRGGDGSVLPSGDSADESLSAANIAARFSKKSKRKAVKTVEDLTLDNAPVGEVEVSEHLLVGREVDESTLRSQKLVEQVAAMVKQDPAVAVNVLQRWIDSEYYK
ncbi:MAG: hypothetical protein FWC56_04400 [Phycisphaerae bacterium]|nr:hypothetical protein [Phycisphaerae bacterium]